MSIRVIDPVTNEKYFKGKLLGSGGFSKVFLIVKESTLQLFAGKIIDTREPNINTSNIQNEINLHIKLKHPNILNMEVSFYFDEVYFCIITDYCVNSDLKVFMKNRTKLEDSEIRFCIAQMIEGLKYLHSQQIIHRDIKAANILLDEKMNLKIADFGFATTNNDYKVLGTPNYMAPEIFGKKAYDYKVDIWALGVIIYFLHYNNLPFNALTANKKFDLRILVLNIKSYNYYFKGNINPDLKDLISGILQPAASRLSLDEIISHPFMNGEITILEYK